MQKFLLAFLALGLVACARTEAVRTSANSIFVQVSAAPACGSTGAVNVASQLAAIETIRAGFDKYIIESGVSRSFNGYDQGFSVRMFKERDPLSANAISARETLGSSWQEKVSKGISTCTQ